METASPHQHTGKPSPSPHRNQATNISIMGNNFLNNGVMSNQYPEHPNLSMTQPHCEKPFASANPALNETEIDEFKKRVGDKVTSSRGKNTIQTLSNRNDEQSFDQGKKEARKIKRISRERSAHSKDRSSNYTLQELEKKDRVKSGKSKRVNTSRDESVKRRAHEQSNT